MKKTMLFLLLLLSFPVIALAQQAGGLPALQKQVQALQQQVQALQAQDANLQTQISNIQLTPGGIDKSKLYDSTCLQQTTCACSDENDILLSGGAICAGSGEVWPQVLMQSAPLQNSNAYYAVCYSIPMSQNVAPEAITVRCLRP